MVTLQDRSKTVQKQTINNNLGKAMRKSITHQGAQNQWKSMSRVSIKFENK